MSELLELWQRAEAMARRWCWHSIRELEFGDGGFYDQDDFLQDCFLLFRKIWLRWSGSGESEARLWKAWSWMLGWGGGNVLKSPPQRLWDRRIDTRLFDQNDDSREWLPSNAKASLATMYSPEKALLSKERAKRLVDAWSKLSPRQRKVALYQFEGLTGAEAAEILGISLTYIYTLRTDVRRVCQEVVHE